MTLKILSPQQRRVLLLVAKGYSNKQIGKIMQLSPVTVDKYIGHTRDKLNVRTRVEAGELYWKLSGKRPKPATSVVRASSGA